MQIVIEMLGDDYKRIKDMPDAFNSLTSRAYRAIKNGVQLPEGHGKIGDLDKLIGAMKERNDDNGGEPLNAVDRGYDLAFQHMIEESKEYVIIEADKEVSK